MKCKRLCAAILSLVMIISLLPTTALAAEENDVWSTPYDKIRVYMDGATKADHDNLEGNFKQVRLYTSKAVLGEYVFCTPGESYWEYSNRLNLPKYKVTANDITNIDLARDEAIGHSPTISIPIEGNTKYKVTVSQQHHQGAILFGHEVDSYDYLRIYISRRTPHNVTYEFSGPAPENVSVPVDTTKYTETSPVTLLAPAETSVTGTLNGQDGIWTFNGWTLPDGVDFTDETHTKFTMPDEDVTVTGKWTFTPTTSVYVYFRTVDTAGDPIGDKDNENVKGVKHNENGNGWATLGKLVTATAVTKETALGNEINDNNSNFTRHSSNSGLDLSLIKSWGAPHKEENGAADYVEFGTEAWHLDGKVTAYRAIYCDSDGNELTEFAPNKTPQYYLEGTADIGVSTEQPTAPAGKEFDCWVTNDVTVKNNAFKMPDHDVTFTAKWKPGALEIEKILDEKSPAAGNIFSFTVTPQGSTTSTDAQITGAGNATISDLLIGNYTVAEDANTAAVNGYRCATRYKTAGSTWQNDPITVSVASNATVTVYVKNSYTPITADLIDDAITIYHKVSDRPDWHGEDIGANINMTYNYTDTNAHTVPKAADATISYQATLDMQNLEFGVNPEHADTVFKIKKLMQDAGTTSLWKIMMGNPIVMFTGSEVNLHVKFSEMLDVTAESLQNIELASGWFKLDPDKEPTYNNTTGYWTIPCVIKNADDKPNTNDSIITLSGITLPLTADAQDELRSDTALDITSGGYIDGTIKISTKNFNESIPYVYSLIGQPISHTYELSLIGRSKEAPAQNTAKLKLATYTVTYDANGGSGTMTDTNSPYAYEVVAKVLTNGFTRSRYTFTGWNTKADGSGKPYAEGDSIDVTGNIVLYAQWSKNSSRDDDDDKYFFAIQKVDAQDGHALNGAKFELYQLDKNGEVVNPSETKTRQHSSKNGIALFSVSATQTRDGGSTWYYREITAPEGYVLDRTEYEINAKDFSDSLSIAVKYADPVRNYRGTTPDLLNGDDHFAYVVGYQDGCVHPNALITRAETATIFFRLLKDSVRDGNLLTSNTFADVPNDYWANTAISTMAGLGIVQGYNSTAFDPNASITRAEFAAICARFDTGKSSGTQTFSDIKGHWAEKYIERAAELGWIKGFEDGTFRPNDCITRAQAMTMINRVLNRIPEDASDLLPDMNVWPDCNPGDWFYLAVQEATNSHDFKHKAGNYETWTSMKQDPDWTRYEN